MDTTKTEIKELLRIATPDEVVFAHIESPYWDEVVCYMEGDVLAIWSSEDNERQEGQSFVNYAVSVLERRRDLIDKTIEQLKRASSLPIWHTHYGSGHEVILLRSNRERAKQTHRID